MKKIIIVIIALCGMYTFSPATIVLANSNANTVTEKDKDRRLEKIDDLFYTDEAEYQFIYRGATEMPLKNNRRYEIQFWIFNFTNISDEPIGVRLTALMDLEIKVEDEFTITDHDDDGIYQVELLGDYTFVSAGTDLSKIKLKPGATIPLLYYGQFHIEDDAEDSDEEIIYLEFKEWFNSDNSGKVYPYGHEETT